MTCQDVIDRDIAEEYLLGRLADPVREEFEQHYFDCERCFADLEAMRAVQSELRQRPRQRRPDTLPRRTRFAARWIAVAATILLLIGADLIWGVSGLIRALRQRPATNDASRVTPRDQSNAAGQPPPVEELQRLARVTPPPAPTTRLRSGPSAPAGYAGGMSRYRAGDYAAAVPLLAGALRAEPSAEAARFYLGASQLLAGDAAGAVATLSPLAQRERSAYAEESRFLIAKAYLGQGDTTKATDMLSRTIAMHGDRQAEAVALRDAVGALRSR
jgi:anti-sigma factor RsiW